MRPIYRRARHAHDISIRQVPQIVTSALSLCCTVPILYLMARELQRHLLPVLLAPGVLIAVDPSTPGGRTGFTTAETRASRRLTPSAAI